MLTPTGFWSYATSDETSSRGKLSQLRALLSAELQQQVGREPRVNIFQDVAAIPPGKEWEAQIQNAIEESSFLIPIITPAFLQSEWCCQEVSLFRAREAKLGVKSLVFPLHYVDVDHIAGADPSQCSDAAVLAFLRTRQWTDFRRLRLRSQESEEVSLLLEKLAGGLLAALREAARERTQRERAEREQAERKRAEQEHAEREKAARERLAEKKTADIVRRVSEDSRRPSEVAYTPAPTARPVPKQSGAPAWALIGLIGVIACVAAYFVLLNPRPSGVGNSVATSAIEPAKPCTDETKFSDWNSCDRSKK